MNNSECQILLTELCLYVKQIRNQNGNRKGSGLCETSFLRHLRILANARIVSLDSNGLYSLAKPRNSLEAIFLVASAGHPLPPHLYKCGGNGNL